MSTSPEIKAAFRHYLQRPRNVRRAYGDARPLAVVALALARKDVAEGRRRYAPDLKGAGVCWQPSEPGRAYIESPESVGLRLVGRVSPEGRRGWFSDNPAEGWITDPHGDVFRDGTGLCWGVVYQLPGRNGESRFIAGYQFGGSEAGPTLDLSRVYAEPAAFWEPVRKGHSGMTYGGYWSYQSNPRDMDSAHDAARAADNMAQHAAEEERDYQTAWAAGSRYADEAADIAAHRAEIKGILAERRALKGQSSYPALCGAITARVRQLLSNIAKGRKRMADLAEGDFPDLTFWNSDARLRDAFCEGANMSEFPAR